MKRIKLLFGLFVLAVTFANCGHYPDGTSVYGGGVWVLFILSLAAVVGGIIVFNKSSHGGSIAGKQAPYDELPSLPWYKSGWGWALVIAGVGLALAVIIIQNADK